MDVKGGRGGTKKGGTSGSKTGGTSGSKTGGAGGSATGGTSGNNTGGSPATGGAGGTTIKNVPPPSAPSCTDFAVTAFDFSSAHSDFQSDVIPNDPTLNTLTTGLVKKELGSDGKPQYIGPDGKVYIKNAASFSEWWKPVANMNMKVDLTLKQFKRNALLNAIGSEDVMVDYYPLDGKGLGNVDYKAPDMPKNDPDKILDESHNQLYSLQFEGEFFFQGDAAEIILLDADDDAWVFINGKLALDAGGLHGIIPASVSLDDVVAEFGLVPGKKYKINVFFADRQFGLAKFRLSNNLYWTHCQK